MLTMEQIEAAMYQKMKSSERLEMDEFVMERGEREDTLKWFVDTQAVLILSDGRFPPWFHGFISRHETEDQLRDKNVGCFLIRLSEKANGYILSYKGLDRCRHFVINQTNPGLFVISGDSTTHNSLTELIDHFKMTPIQPFGEYLTSYLTDMESTTENSTNEVYDVVQNKPTVNSGVSVKALRSLWEQTSNAQHSAPPVLSAKNSRKLTTSTSIDRNTLSQGMKTPPLPKKNAPLRNSISAGFSSNEQHKFSQSKTSEWSGCDERVNEGRSDAVDTKGYNSALTRPFYHESNPALTSDYSNPMPSIPQQPPVGPPKTASCSYAVLDLKKVHAGSDRVSHAGQAALEPNPLYQASSVVYDEPEYDNPLKPNENIVVENPYQDLTEQRDNNTYEHIPESNTYEDIRGTDSNMYASLDEVQTHAQNVSGKKSHKWWKLRQENKK